MESKTFDWSFIFCTEKYSSFAKKLKNIWTTQEKIIMKLLQKCISHGYVKNK